MITQTLPQVTTGQIHTLTKRLRNILQHKQREHIQRIRLEILTEDIELAFGKDAIDHHPVISQLYETIQEEREAVS